MCSDSFTRVTVGDSLEGGDRSHGPGRIQDLQLLFCVFPGRRPDFRVNTGCSEFNMSVRRRRRLTTGEVKRLAI